MRVFAVLTCLLVLGCEAQRPQPCRIPRRLTGGFTLSIQDGKPWHVFRYTYDGLRQRVRLEQMGSYENETVDLDVLLLFKEGVMFKINEKEKTCKKTPLEATFDPWRIPPNSSFIGQSFLGTSSKPGAGLLINSWLGKEPLSVSTVTEYACIPVSAAVHLDESGWMLVTFFNNVIGITDPQKLNPPAFCPKSNVDTGEEEPADLFTFLMKKH